MDNKTIRRDGDVVNIWWLTNDLTPDHFGAKSYTALHEVNGRKGLFRTLQRYCSKGHFTKDHIIYSSIEKTNWLDPVVGTYLENVVQEACSVTKSGK